MNLLDLIKCDIFCLRNLPASILFAGFVCVHLFLFNKSRESSGEHLVSCSKDAMAADTVICAISCRGCDCCELQRRHALTPNHKLGVRLNVVPHVSYFSGNTFLFFVGDSKEQAVNFSGYQLRSCQSLKFQS